MTRERRGARARNRLVVGAMLALPFACLLVLCAYPTMLPPSPTC